MFRRQIFRAVLRHALEVRFGSKRITASQFANAYNLITDDPITTETARKWISGLGIPRYERIFELVHWLNINPNDLFQANYLPPCSDPNHQLLDKKSDSELTLMDIRELTQNLKKRQT